MAASLNPSQLVSLASQQGWLTNAAIDDVTRLLLSGNLFSRICVEAMSTLFQGDCAFVQSSSEMDRDPNVLGVNNKTKSCHCDAFLWQLLRR
jgi:hypothetical protein